MGFQSKHVVDDHAVSVNSMVVAIRDAAGD